MPDDPDELADLATAKLHRGEAAGNAAAARALERHRGLIVRHCERVCLAGYELDDLIQESYMAGLEAIRYFRPELGFKFSTYLMDCVRRRVGKFMGENRPPEQEGEDESLDMLAAHTAVDPDWLAGVMDQLTPLDRQVLALKFGLEGGGALDSAEVGKRLGVSRDTAEWRAWEAALRLKQLLGVADRPPGTDG